jgi:hypothetical protein
MSFKISIEKVEEYLSVKVTGKETLDNVLEAWRKVAEACQKYSCRKIIFDGCLEGPGRTLDIYEFGERIREIGMPVGVKIAVICKEDDLKKLQFAETVVANRAPICTRNFLNKKDAETWLAAKKTT